MFTEVYSRQLIDLANLARVGVISGTRHVDQCVSLAFKMFNENNSQFLATLSVNRETYFTLSGTKSQTNMTSIFFSLFYPKRFYLYDFIMAYKK